MKTPTSTERAIQNKIFTARYELENCVPFVDGRTRIGKKLRKVHADAKDLEKSYWDEIWRNTEVRTI